MNNPCDFSGIRGEVFVDGPHRTRTLTNGGRNSLHGTRPDVSDGEDSGRGGFEWQWLPFGKDGMVECVTR